MSTLKLEQMVFKTRTAAEETLTQLCDFIEKYGDVTVADYYEIIGLTPTYIHRKYGWKSLINSTVVLRVGGFGPTYKCGFIITLPDPELLIPEYNPLDKRVKEDDGLEKIINNMIDEIADYVEQNFVEKDTNPSTDEEQVREVASQIAPDCVVDKIIEYMKKDAEVTHELYEQMQEPKDEDFSTESFSITFGMLDGVFKGTVVNTSRPEKMSIRNLTSDQTVELYHILRGEY